VNTYREPIRDNIEYDILLCHHPYEKDRVNITAELMTETVCFKRRYIPIAGNDFPAESAESRLLKVNSEHIRFAFGCLEKNTTKARNSRRYLLTTIDSAPPENLAGWKELFEKGCCAAFLLPFVSRAEDAPKP